MCEGYSWQKYESSLQTKVSPKGLLDWRYCHDLSLKEPVTSKRPFLHQKPERMSDNDASGSIERISSLLVHSLVRIPGNQATCRTRTWWEMQHWIGSKWQMARGNHCYFCYLCGIDSKITRYLNCHVVKRNWVLSGDCNARKKPVYEETSQSNKVSSGRWSMWGRRGEV